MRIACISDIHTRPVITPAVDVLIVSGDITKHSSDAELAWFKNWLAEQPAEFKIVIPGNHDKKFQTHPYWAAEYIKQLCADGKTFFLVDSFVTINGITFWGSPWTPAFRESEGAYTLKSVKAARDLWQKIPAELDVLITHGPPYGILDQIKNGKHVGDAELLQAVKRVKPRAHVFGHVHTGHGKVEIDGILFVNGAVVNDEDWNYKVIHDPIVFDIEPIE